MRVSVFIAFAVVVISGCFANVDVCNNFLQMHLQCVGGTKTTTVDYDIINTAIDEKFRDTEARINQKIATCSEALEVLEKKFLSVRVTDCGKVSRDDAKSTRGDGGVFDIYVNQAKTEVYCDFTTDGGGWLVFQRREDGSEDFYRGWKDYVKGFGDKRKEFWMGLEKLHKITSTGRYELRVELEDWSGNKKYAKYTDFKIGNAATKYKLTIGGYSGNAGDSISRENGRSFTTKDSDNDPSEKNCAVLYKGGWWYGACHEANLNGLYFKGGSHSSYADGVNWRKWKGYNYSLKFVEMKIRLAV